jgi:hypothetical protein
MTNLLYTEQQLQSKKLADLKAIASQLNATATDKRSKESWVNAILSAQPQPITQQITQQAALKPLVEMSGDDCIVDGEIVATITSDDDLTQPWRVLINSIEVHRAATWARCYDYVRSHAKYGTLPNPQPELVDDYLFHNDPQPVKLPAVGDSHFIGDRLLRCIKINEDYAAVWDVISNAATVGEIKMDWQCNWHHTLSFELFATPQEAMPAAVNYASLCESATELIEKPELEVIPSESPNLFTVTNHESGNQYKVCLESNSCTCPHWAHRNRQAGFKDKHIDAVKIFCALPLRERLCHQLT